MSLHPLLIIAGTPQGIVQRNKDFRPSVPGWDVRFVHSRHHRVPDLHSCWNEVLETADHAEESGSHILAVHVRDQDRPGFSHDIYSRHRLVWLDRSALAVFGRPEFEELLVGAARFESQWRDALRPTHPTQSALILPEPSFDAYPRVAEIWKRTHLVHSTRDSLGVIVDHLHQFRDHHRSQGTWVDRRQIVFDGRGDWHAECPLSRRWKYTFLLPSRFHFDVRHSDRSSFNIRDRTGVVHNFRRYTNVDAHGVIRGGD